MHYWVDLTVGAGFIVAWLLTQFRGAAVREVAAPPPRVVGSPPAGREIWMQDQTCCTSTRWADRRRAHVVRSEGRTFYRWKDTWQNGRRGSVRAHLCTRATAPVGAEVARLGGFSGGRKGQKSLVRAPGEPRRRRGAAIEAQAVTEGRVGT